MILSNVNIFTRECQFQNGAVEVEDGRIKQLIFDDSFDSSNATDCNGNYLIPGLVDIHTHGCNGHDFCEGTAEAFDAITSYEIQNGITSICPATMTYPEDKLMPVMEAVSNYKNESGAEILGINMEGPFISKKKVGAQNPNYVQEPNEELVKKLNVACNNKIKLIDIAPEVDGALDFIKKMSKDFVISVAHTNCTYEVAKEAYKLGAKHLTHTFNAMPPILHRSPGPILAASEAGANAELICDGQHVSYASVRLAFGLFKNSLCLISDSCEATGLEDGQYSLGGQDIVKLGDKVVLKDSQDTIAASATNLFACLKHAIFDAQINKEQAIAAATINPAKAIGADSLYGSIEPGKYADFLLLDDKFDLKAVYKKGNKIC